jgi:hypothetical protein
VKKVINAARGFGADAWNLGQIGNRGPFDGFERAEMAQQGTFASRSDAGNLLQSGFANVAAAALAMGPDGKPMSLVTQALDKVEHRIARRQAERLPASHVKRFSPSIAIGTLRNAHQRNIYDTESGQRLARCAKLPLAAVDKDQVGPGLIGVLFIRGGWSGSGRFSLM